MAKFQQCARALILYAGFAAGSAAFADDVFVAPTVYAGPFPSHGQITYEIVRAAVTDGLKHGLVGSPDAADYILEARLNESENFIQLTLDKRLAGRVISTKSTSMTEIEELPAHVKYLVDQATNTQPYYARREVGSLVSTGVTPPNRRKDTMSMWYFSYGPAVSGGLNAKDVMANINIGGAWEVDSNLLKVYYTTTNGLNSDQAGLKGLGASASYLLTAKSESTAFINGDLIWGNTEYTTVAAATQQAGEVQSKQGFLYGFGAGMISFRNSEFSVETALQVNSFMGRTDNGVPSTFGLRVGLLW